MQHLLLLAGTLALVQGQLLLCGGSIGQTAPFSVFAPSGLLTVEGAYRAFLFSSDNGVAWLPLGSITSLYMQDQGSAFFFPSIPPAAASANYYRCLSFHTPFCLPWRYIFGS